MVLPPSLVSETGNDCDLVGTSFVAFRNQVVGLMATMVICCHTRVQHTATTRTPQPVTIQVACSIHGECTAADQ
jgi:hypothetical protein